MRGLRVRNSISNEKRAVVTWPNSRLSEQGADRSTIANRPLINAFVNARRSHAADRGPGELASWDELWWAHFAAAKTPML